MDDYKIREILSAVRLGEISELEAEKQLISLVRRAPFKDLGFARVDHHRAVRQGFPEVIFGLGKTPEQIAEIAKSIVTEGQSLLVTRTDEEAYIAVRNVVQNVCFHELARSITQNNPMEPTGHGVILVMAAGTSDLPVAEEARVSAETMGNRVDTLYDVGVSGIHRVLAEEERLNAARVIIAVAGMEGALPSVIGGLVKIPIIAVPTSVGYGSSFGGLTAMLGMLNSCASGIAVVNIDNGFGAAAMASTINHLD